MSDHRTGSIPVLGIEYAPIAQLDRVSDYESEGCRFDSYWVHYREIAQFGRALGLGPRGRRFESCFPDLAKQLRGNLLSCFFVVKI